MSNPALTTRLTPVDELEQLIVVPLDHTGTVDTSHGVCLPAEQGFTQTFTDRMSRNNGIPPYDWPSVCGRVGIVYAKGGPFETVQMCVRCVVPAATVKVASGRAAPRWDRASILAAVARWAAEHGGPPSQTSWRRRGEWWPSASYATKVFGSWAAVLEAAGFEPNRVGRPRVWHPHGTEKRYFQGCRDECCRVAHRDASRLRDEAKRAA